MIAVIFILFAGMAIGCAVSVVVQRHPLYGAMSLVGVFVSLAGLYVTLAAPFIAAVQVIVYAGAIMVLVVFVIMLLNVEQEERRRPRLPFLVGAAVTLAGVLFAEAAFILYFVQATPVKPRDPASDVGLTFSIGSELFTRYLLPFEITSLLLLMAIVGAMTLARTGGLLSANTGVVPGAQVLAPDVLDPKPSPGAQPIVTNTSDEAARVLGIADVPRRRDEN
ncbi:MAG: NADH-quinone oxidoreductase subunit [Blastocatellia bacterium]|jgi:NADH-quinone oxidoreductase subunit J|nr:NADH-quinone oxidoreductase subunit [Blastocatellia bacterium]